MCMLNWMRHNLNDIIRNKEKKGVTTLREDNIEYKMKGNCLYWFGHILRSVYTGSKLEKKANKAQYEMDGGSKEHAGISMQAHMAVDKNEERTKLYAHVS